MLRDDGRRERATQHIDGLGRELATYTQTETGYIVSNSKWFDHQGREVKTFRPWETNLSTYVLPTQDLIATQTARDAHGRPLTETLPADEQGRRSVMRYQYQPRQITITDPAGYQQIKTINAQDAVLSIQQQHQLSQTGGGCHSLANLHL